MNSRRRRRKAPWWSAWPAALALGLSSLLMLTPWLLAVIALVLLPDIDASGMDRSAVGPGSAPRIIATLLALVSLSLPVLTVRWARKIWKGYMLLGICLSGGFCVLGLGLLGVV